MKNNHRYLLVRKSAQPGASVALGCSLVSFAITSLIAGWAAPASVHAATELAKINGTTISLEDFEKKYTDNLRFFQFKAPSRKTVLEDMIKREVAIQEAVKLGLDKDPEIIDRMNTVLYQALIERSLAKEFEDMKVSDSEAEAYYKKNPEIRTSHIFVAVAPNAKPADEAKAKARINKILTDYLKPGKVSFAEVAQRYSDGAAAPMGGDIDYQTPDKLAPEYYAEAKRLTVGQYGGIIRSQYGFHIVKKTAVRPWDEADKGQIKGLVMSEKRQAAFEKFIGKLRSNAKIVVKNELLKD